MNGRLDLPYVQRRVLDHHRYDEEVLLSSGNTSQVYYDLREAMLCTQCMNQVTEHFLYFLAERRDRLRVVSTGTFGAMLLTRLADRWSQVTLDRDYPGVPHPMSLWLQKDHGRQWVHSNNFLPTAGESVILVDDVATTGVTLTALEDAGKEAFGWKVVDRLVFLDRRGEW